MMAPSSSYRKFAEFYRIYYKRQISLIVIYGIILALCSAILATEAAQNERFPTKLSSNCNGDNKNPNCDPKTLIANRTPRQQQPSASLTALINWLFGPPVNVQQSGHSAENSTTNFMENPEPKISQPIATGEKDGKQVSNDPNSTIITSEEPSVSELRHKYKKNIEITHIQPSVGTELHSTQLKDGSSQANLKDGLELVEKFDQSVKNSKPKADSSKRTGRLKREPYKPIKVPYTTTKSNDLTNNILRQRQLLVNPFDQQMMALQQQQAAAAAAAMLQQQQMDSFLNGNRYPVLDDYDREDDDDSEEDSDEFDDFTRFGPPMIEHHHMYLRNGLPPQVPVPPFQRKLGWGLKRRSVADKKKQEQRRKLENGDGLGGRGKTEVTQGRRRGVGKYKNRASLKTGHWLLDDYDLNSEFHSRPQERKNMPTHLSDRSDHIESPELDEEEHYEKHHKNKKVQDKAHNEEVVKQRGDMEPIYREFRDSICNGNECPKARQDETSSVSENMNSSEGSADPGESSSEGPTDMGGSSSEGPTDMGGSSSEGSTDMGGSSSEGPTDMGGSSSEGPTDMGGSSSEGSSGAGESTSEGSIMPGGNSTEGSDNSGTTMEGSATGGADSSTTTESTDSSTSETTTKPKPKPPYKATLNCRCGTQSVRGGVIGDGTVVRINVNPWLVAISDGDSHMCSGSIVNDRYVLTSKSCVQGSPMNALNVKAGLTSSNSTSYRVTKVSTNPNVNLALLQLNSAIKPSHMMRPLCLPIGKRYAGEYSTGNLVTFKKAAKTVQMVDTEVSILGNGNPKCKSTSKGTLCAGPPGSMKCGGDSGGVLMVYRGGYSYEQIGVVAGTVGCRTNGSPGIYTDIRKRTRWILNNSKEGNFCKSPMVTDDDLMSTTRVGDPYFELNEDFEDPMEFENMDFGDDVDSAETEEDNRGAEVLDSSLEQ